MHYHYAKWHEKLENSLGEMSAYNMIPNV